jgi:hypothetical protein
MIALMMEAVSTSEMSADFYHNTRRNIPEDNTLFSTLINGMNTQFKRKFNIIVPNFSE